MILGNAEIIQGDALEVLRTLPAGSVHCCITSPPYWGLRDYGVAGQLGLESTPEEYTARLVEIFREVRRVLRDDGTAWLNLGDSYAGSGKGPSNAYARPAQCMSNVSAAPNRWISIPSGIKPKDLIGIPWRVAFALQADGWYLRSDIIWSKPNPMPESVTDRPTKAHEYIFLLSKSARYHYDADAVREPDGYTDHPRNTINPPEPSGGLLREHMGIRKAEGRSGTGRNRRTVWTVPTQPYTGAHFAVFPPELIRPCVLAGCPVGGTVLDPFAGSGTTGLVALQNGRAFLGIELNAEYMELIRERLEPAVSQGKLEL